MYFEHDFEWAEVAAERHSRCAGEDAPVLVDASDRLDAGSLASAWEAFFQRHAGGFFKARSYLSLAFPVLVAGAGPDVVIGEVGAGTGSSILPLLKALPGTAVVFDASPAAVAILQASAPEGRVAASVCDAVRDDSWPMRDASLDAMLVVFTLSAIAPEHHLRVLDKACAKLKPGGHLCFRDYGLYDMVQMRCEVRVGQPGQHAYLKEDNIQVVFFSLQDVARLAAQIPGVSVKELRYCTVRTVNRKKKINIDRVFVHALLVKDVG